MALTLTCPHCGATRPVADAERGRLVRCGQCGLRTRAPGEPAAGPPANSEPGDPDTVGSGGRLFLFLIVGSLVVASAGVVGFVVIPRHGPDAPIVPPAPPAAAARLGPGRRPAAARAAGAGAGQFGRVRR